MMIVADASCSSVAWRREPTKDQWLAWTAAWLGWMLDAFDFAIFLLIMGPITNEFGVSDPPGSVFDARYKDLTADAGRLDAAICRQRRLRSSPREPRLRQCHVARFASAY